VNRALDLLGALVLENGRRWGECAAPFQTADARAVLDPDARPYHFLTRARGGSKTSDLAGMAVAAMLAQLAAGSRLYALAADRDQGRLLLDSIDGFASRTPELRGALRVDAYRVTAARSGSVLDVLAADAPSAWGLRPSFTIIDEIAAWPTTPGARKLFEAVTTAAGKVPRSRMVLLTTAGDPAHWSRKVLDHAKRDRLWRVHEVAGPPPWIDRERLSEQRRRLLPSVYARLFENVWTSAEDRLVSDDDLRACVTLDGPLPPEPGRRYVVAVDLGVTRDATVAAVCHAERVTTLPAGQAEPTTTGARVVLDRLEVWHGSRDRPVQLSDVETWVREASRAYQGASVVVDPWQAVGMAQRLRTHGIRVVEFTFSSASVGRVASVLHRLLRDRMIALPDDEALIDELAHVRLVEGSPGVVRLAHDSDRHDDMAVALAMAAAHLLERPVHSGAAATSGGDSPDGFRSALLGDVSALADRSGKLDPSLSYGSEF